MPSIGPGVRLGEYRILSHLRSGSTGEFWLALAPHLDGRIVAIKVIQPWKRQRRPDYLDALRRKVALLARLDHPGLPSIYEVAHTERHDYVVMEYVAGRTLEELRGGPVPPPLFTIAVLVQVCDVLGYLKAQLLTPEDEQLRRHQFLSPRKLVVSLSGRVQLLGMGLAQVNAQLQDIPSHARFAKFAYTAPEHLRPGSDLTRSDSYGMGAVLYSLLTAVEPFAGAQSLYNLIQRIQEGNPRPVAQLNPEALAPLREIVAQAMSVRPEQRPDRAAVHAMLRQARVVLPEPEGTAALRSYVAAMFPGAPVLDGLLAGLRSLDPPAVGVQIATETAPVVPTEGSAFPDAATCSSEAPGAPSAPSAAELAPPNGPASGTASDTHEPAAEPSTPSGVEPAQPGVAEATDLVRETHGPVGDVFAGQPSRAAGKDPDLYSSDSRMAPRDIFASRSGRAPAEEPGPDIFSPPTRAPAADIFAAQAARVPPVDTLARSDPFAAAGRPSRDSDAFATQPSRGAPGAAATGSDPFAAPRDVALARPQRELAAVGSRADPFAQRGQRLTAATGVPVREGGVFASQDRRPPASSGGDPFAARTVPRDELPRWPALQAPRPPRGQPEPPREERPAAEPRPEEDRPPSEAALCFDRGLLALRNGNMIEALRLWTEAVELEPGNRIYQVNLQRLRTIGERR
jgi:hypothetical protein